MTFNKPAGVVLAAFATLAGGCATSPHAGVSSLFVKHGSPTLSYDVDVEKASKAAGRLGNPKHPSGPSPLQRMESATSVESTDKALREALAALKRGDNTANRLRAAAEYRRLHILDRAHEQLTAALEHDSRSVAAFEQRAQIWREWGLPNFGMGDAYRAAFLAPKSPSAQNTLGTLLQAAGQMDAARAAYLRATELNPDAAYAWNNLCYLSLSTGNPVRAIGECQRAVQLAPRLEAARNNMALSYAAAGMVEEARDELLANGQPGDAAFNLGMLYMSLGRYKLAEESFRVATDIRPNFSAAATRRRQAGRLAAEKDHIYEHSDRD
jgi:tetratricopeptide (TPR) repeat protein